ncbi:urease accessory protein UreE [Rhodobacter sp. KR11]|uniref:urease accessory protein UreE n=1 Tax=Rhodobacter sp. KR11 TaxID=2974588 RepID=UPI002223139B|nr:urease accessory protein UreE [Rhodobacter sp. KR11]MCW1918526.1 urease accessory protein UreE [Rhodobacter sp. KR11]
MSLLTTARQVIRSPKGVTAHDHVTLTYDERFLRRKRLVTAHDLSFMVNLAETLSLNHGDCFGLDDGRLIQVIAAEEPVVVIQGDLARLAWHIGNRHTPCQIEAARLLIRQDHVIEAMLAQLGATLSRAIEPFTPEGGAYGHGRTMGHSHGENSHGENSHGEHGHGGHSHGGHSHAPAFDPAAPVPLFPFAMK